MSTRDENMVAALRRERATYVAKGKDDRVQQVDDQLRRLGAASEPGGGEGPQGRTPGDPAQQTADRSSAATAGTGGEGPATEAASTPAAVKKAPRRSTAKE
ncbi:hypothetical protein [Streptomyces nitrosporeus]|uniref:hypothetical protein n=1 Tax=Streptomyces nitrosporeus TaxID=28894 RepID=UPI0039A32335